MAGQDWLDALAALQGGVQAYGNTNKVFQGVDDAQLNYLTNAAKLYGLDLGNEGTRASLDTYQLDAPVRGAKREADILLQNLDEEKRRDAINSTTGFRDYYNSPEFAEAFKLPAGSERTDAMARIMQSIPGLGKEAETSRQGAFKGQANEFQSALQLMTLAPSEATVGAVNQYIEKMPGVAGNFSIGFDADTGSVFLTKTSTGENVPISAAQLPFLAKALSGADSEFGIKVDNTMRKAQSDNAITAQRTGGGAPEKAAQERLHATALKTAESGIKTEIARRAKAGEAPLSDDEIRTAFTTIYRRNNPGTARQSNIGGGLGGGVPRANMPGPNPENFKNSMLGRRPATIPAQPASGGQGDTTRGQPDPMATIMALPPDQQAQAIQMIQQLMTQGPGGGMGGMGAPGADYAALAAENGAGPGAGSAGLPPELQQMIEQYLMQGQGASNMHMAPPAAPRMPYQITPPMPLPQGQLRRIYGGS